MHVHLHLMLSTMSLPTEISLNLSVLDANNTIALEDNMMLAILHAHTRASVIINFCLPHTFTLFEDLDQDLSLYWTKYANMDQMAAVGHPMGTLQRIYYLNCHGLPYNSSSESKAYY